MNAVSLKTGLIGRFQSYFTIPVKRDTERNRLKSLTTEGKSLSLQEIIKRDQIQLVTPKNGAEPFYDDTIVIPDFKRMDLVEIDLWREALDKERDEVFKTIKREKAEREFLAKEAADKAKQESAVSTDRPVAGDSGSGKGDNSGK